MASRHTQRVAACAGASTMKKLATLLIWLVVTHQTRTQHGQDGEFDIHEFKDAVVQAYNASNPFSQNFYELLGLICPESVYCQTNGTFDTENADFRDIVEDETFVPDDVLQNYDQAAISEARIFLQRHADHVAGCCVACSCNDDCGARHNCCPSLDTTVIKSAGSEPTDIATEECVYANIKSYYSTHRFRFAETVGQSYFMGINCASANVSEDIATRCTRPNLDTPDETNPVYSTEVERIYKNIFCARCNDVSPVTALAPSITVNHMLSFTGKSRLPNSPRELYRMATSNVRIFSLRFQFPSNQLNIQNFGCVYRPASLPAASSLCDENVDLDPNQIYLFKRACETKQYLYHNNLVLFSNVFCFLCYSSYSSNKPICRTFGKSDRNVLKDSFSALITNSLSESGQPEVTTEDTTLCSCAEMFDTSKKLCREILCPPGEMRIVCDCVPFITNITGMRIKLHLELRPELPESVSKKTFGGELQTDVPAAITKAVKRLIASQFGPLTSIRQFLFRQRNATIDVLTFHYREVLTLKGTTDDRKEFENMFTTLNAGLIKQIVGTQMKLSLGRYFDLGPSSNISIPSIGDGTDDSLEVLYPGPTEYERDRAGMDDPQPLKKLVFCKRVKLVEDEEERLYNVTAALGWPCAYLEYVYWQEDGSMCLEDFEAAFMPNNNSGANSYNNLTEGNQILMISTLAVHIIMLSF